MRLGTPIKIKEVNKVFLHQTPLKAAVLKRYQDESGYAKLRSAASWTQSLAVIRQSLATIWAE